MFSAHPPNSQPLNQKRFFVGVFNNIFLSNISKLLICQDLQVYQMIGKLGKCSIFGLLFVVDSKGSAFEV